MALTQISTDGIKNGTITGSDLATNVDLVDNQKIRFGTGNDLEIYHNGFTSIIGSASHTLAFYSDTHHIFHNANGSETLAKFIPNGAVELYYDNTKRLETDASGVKLSNGRFYSAGTFAFIESSDTSTTTLTLKKSASGADSIDYLQCRDSSNNIKLVISGSGDVDIEDNAKLKLGTGDDLQIYHDGTFNYIAAPNNHEVHINANSGGSTENMAKFKPNGAVELYHDNSKKFETTSGGASISNNLSFPDNGYAMFGAGNDLQIYHSGTDTFFKNQTGSLNFFNSGVTQFRNAADNETLLKMTSDGSVELYYDNSKKLETTSTGATVTGTLAATNTNITTQMFMPDNGQIRLGNSDDLKIYHDGSDSYISNVGTGELIIQPTTNETAAVFRTNSSVELFHNNSKKFETSSTGATVTGFLGINVASPDSPLEVAGTGPSLATIHHSDGGTNDEARIMLGALSANPPDQRGAGISARNNGAGHNLEIQTSSSHSAGPSTKMIVTSSGNVGIGTTSPAKRLEIKDNSSNNFGSGIRLSQGYNSVFSEIASNFGGSMTLNAGQGTTTAVMHFQVNDDEKMRISNDGNVGIGKSSTSMDIDGSIFFGNGQQLQIIQSGSGGKAMNIRRRTNVGTLIQFDRTGVVGSISCNNTSTSYNTSSDYRLKENIVTLSDAITRLKTLKAYRFNFIEDKSLTVDGFMAHEVTAVPEAITGTKDAVITQEMIDNKEYEKEQLGDIIPQSIDQSKLVPLLVAALQEAIGRIEILEAK